MEQILRWSPLVSQIAPLYAITPTVALAIIAVETGRTGNPNLVHPAFKATGLMQVVPGEVIPGRPGMAQLKVPAVNIAWGCYLLAYYAAQERGIYGGLYRYSGGSYWKSDDEFAERYWVPFRRAQLEIEAALGERGQMHGKRFFH